MIETKITQDGDFPILKAYVDGESYSFTLLYVEESKREWLRKIIHENYEDIYNKAYNKGRREVQTNIKAALEL